MSARKHISVYKAPTFSVHRYLLKGSNKRRKQGVTAGRYLLRKEGRKEGRKVIVIEDGRKVIVIEDGRKKGD
jgi:hypothetical protein